MNVYFSVQVDISASVSSRSEAVWCYLHATTLVAGLLEYMLELNKWTQHYTILFVCFLDFGMNCPFLVRGKLFLRTVGVVTEPLFRLKQINFRLKKFAPLKKCNAKCFSAVGSALLALFAS